MTDLPKMQAEADRIDLQLFNAVRAIEEFYDKFEPYLQLKDRQALQWECLRKLRATRSVIRSYMDADRREATS